MEELLPLLSLVLSAVLWGVTDALMKQTAPPSSSSVTATLLSLISSPAYVALLLVNQLGSLLYYFSLSLCSLNVEDVVKQEPMMEEIGLGDEAQGGDDVDAVDVEEVEVAVKVIQMEIPNFQIDQATSLQVGDLNLTRRDEEDGVSREEVGEQVVNEEEDVVTEVEEGRKRVHFLDSVKIAKRNIEQQKAYLAEMKQEEEMKRAKLEDLKAEDLEDKIRSSELAKTGAELQKREEELKKRKAELERTVNAVVKEKCEIAERLKKRDAKAADLKAEIEAAERLKMVKEEELRKDEADVQAALLLLQAASPAK